MSDMRLSGIASAIARRPVKVESTFDIPTAAFDHAGQRILVNGNVPYEVARGFVAHELGHEAYTSTKAWNSLTDDTRMYGNLLEDMRINLRLSDTLFRSARGWIMDAWDHLRTADGGQFVPSTPSMEVLYASHNQKQQRGPWAADVDQWLGTHLRQVLDCNGVDEMADAISTLKALDEKWRKDQKPGQKPGQKPEQKQDGGQQDGGGQDGEPQRPSRRHPSGRAKSRGQLEREVERYEKALKAYQQQQRRGSPMHANGEFKPVEGDTTDSDQPGKDGYSGKTGKHQGSREPFAADPYGYWSDINPDVFSGLRNWRNRVADALMSEAPGAPVRNMLRGRLDGSRLHHVVARTSDRVFQRPAAMRRAVNTAVDVMIDQSGSTACMSQHVAAAAYALAEAVSRVPGVQMGILGYDSRYCRMLPIGHNRVRMEQARAVDLGGTETDAIALMSAADLLAVTSVNRRICINMTDGAEATEETQQMMVDLGVEYYEIHFYADYCKNRLPKDTPRAVYCVAEDTHNALDRLIHKLHIKGR